MDRPSLVPLAPGQVGIRAALAAYPDTAGPLMALVSHLPPTDWRVGTPFYVCAVVQFVATVVALLYFSRYGERSASAAARV